MNSAVWASLPLPTTGIARDFLEVVASPDVVGIFDFQSAVDPEEARQPAPLDTLNKDHTP
jgi:hypothetical protein